MSERLAFFKDFPDGWMVVIAERRDDGGAEVIDALMHKTRAEADAWAKDQIGPFKQIWWGAN